MVISILKKIKTILKNVGVRNLCKLFLLDGKEKKLSIPNSNQDVHLRGDSSDTAVFRQIFVEEQYKNHFFNWKIEYIIDGGANIGLSSLYFSLNYKDAHIIAVEPDDINFDLLKKNTDKLWNISYEKAWLWSENVPLAFDWSQKWTWWSNVVKSENNRWSDDVRGITVDELLKKHNYPRVDLLKIDIEGAELNLFSENTSTWLPKVKMIMIELHDHIFPGCWQAFLQAVQRDWKSFSIHQQKEILILINNAEVGK